MTPPLSLIVTVPCAPLVTLVRRGALVPGSSITVTLLSGADDCAKINAGVTVSSTSSRVGAIGSGSVRTMRIVAPSMIVSERLIALPT